MATQLIHGTVVQNRYQIIRLLGQGGFGAVYQARDLRLDQLVALKENIGGDSRQFQQEALILANLRHPNLPRVIDHFVEPNGAQYLVMDFVEGEDLDTILERQGALSEAKVMAWFDQILDAVAYMHSLGIIHRDIKPANIKITRTGQAVLVDFGIAKVFQRGQLTLSGARGMGSEGFAAPEQYRGGTDKRSDIYSLGATLYTALTGSIPPSARALEQRSARLTPPRKLVPSMRTQTERSILHAMAIQPDGRLQNAFAFRTELRESAPQDDNRFPTYASFDAGSYIDTLLRRISSIDLLSRWKLSLAALVLFGLAGATLLSMFLGVLIATGVLSFPTPAVVATPIAMRGTPEADSGDISTERTPTPIPSSPTPLRPATSAPVVPTETRASTNTPRPRTATATKQPSPPPTTSAPAVPFKPTYVNFEGPGGSRPSGLGPFIFPGRNIGVPYGTLADNDYTAWQLDPRGRNGGYAANVIPNGNPVAKNTTIISSAVFQDTLGVSGLNTVTMTFWKNSTSNPRPANIHNCDSSLNVYFASATSEWTHKMALCGTYESENRGWQQVSLSFDVSSMPTIRFAFVYELQNNIERDPAAYYLIDDFELVAK